MAKLPALVTALTEVDGRDRPTIDHYARTIREAGFIPTGKRGVGAAEMDVRAAANLLIALNCGSDAKQAAERVAFFRAFILNDASDPQGFRTFQAINSAQNFGEALELLIGGVPEIILRGVRYIDEKWPEKSDEFRQIAKSRMLASGDVVNCVVKLSLSGVEIKYRAWDDIEWSAEFSIPVSLIETALIMERLKTDRRVTCSFGLPTLIAAFKALLVDDHENVISAVT
ncbi:hypothetical protein [Pleomorphomonas sp. JP5]|uniref:hypothetical protein n=1 Tax=Pleomorphomonas sp. JP5 TaxID=2942998 RepID=UPI002043B93D|nr:hypothetical protein [Pleomorphomonas sp. JP5]MCM5558079.1 hypothetical protein [Pleomorphomonas sp. JP5]